MNVIRDNMAPLMFGGMIAVHADRLPGGVLARRGRIVLRLLGIEFGLIQPDFLGNLDLSAFWRRFERSLLLAIPFFTLMGAILERCGLAEDLLELDRSVVRAGARRPLLCGDFRRRDPRRHHRHSSCIGHRHGRDLDAADDQATAIRRATPWA